MRTGKTSKKKEPDRARKKISKTLRRLSTVNINYEKAREIITHPDFGKKVEPYLFIMRRLRECDVATDKEFQRKFTGFYRVRRGEAFRKSYFCYMETLKNTNTKNISIMEIQSHLFGRHSSVETSFSSKLLATINPDMPIWDVHVLKNLCLKKSYKTGEAKIKANSATYNDMKQKYDEYLKMEEAKEILALFGDKYREISNVKKIDFILWQMR